MKRQYNDKKTIQWWKDNTMIKRQYNDKKKRDSERQTMVHKTLHRKLKIEQHDPTSRNWGWTKLLGKGKEVSAPLVAPVVLLILNTRR